MGEGIMETTYSAEPERVWKFFNPVRISRNLWSERDLIRQLTLREVIGRYRSSYLGFLWAFLNPLLMLAVLTFVFSVVFKAKWGISTDEGKMEFAMTIFCGMIAFNLFSECLNRAPGLIIGSPHYVKKIVFPAEILPVYVLLSSLIHLLISMGILILGIVIFMHRIPWTVIYFPLVLIPLLFLSLGLAWFFASIGVFIRDIGNTIGFLTTLLFFTTPIFYPISALPESLRTVIRVNPLAVIVEDFRRIMIWGRPPDWGWYGLLVFISLMVLLSGYAWFMKSKKAFADVI
jgi:lipopolysaccharide transport system permease protein